MLISPKKVIEIYHADVVDALKEIPSNSVHTVITSIPYWGLRDYEGHPNQLGQESTIGDFLRNIVDVFAEVKRVLHPSGTLWLNVGDSYNSDRTRGTYGDQSKVGYLDHGRKRNTCKGLHKKNLLGQPWRVAFALQEAGWILRDDIIWAKPNPMPYSGTDRTTKSHEILFMFSKSGRYYYDWKALEEISVDGKSVRRCRSVWSIPTEHFVEHHATFPKALVHPCIVAGTSPQVCEKCDKPFERVLEKLEVPEVNEDGYLETYKSKGYERACKHHDSGVKRATVLDPFLGSGTSGVVATQLGRNFIGIEIVEKYVGISLQRMEKECTDLLFTDVLLRRIENAGLESVDRASGPAETEELDAETTGACC